MLNDTNMDNMVSQWLYCYSKKVRKLFFLNCLLVFFIPLMSLMHWTSVKCSYGCHWKWFSLLNNLFSIFSFICVIYKVHENGYEISDGNFLRSKVMASNSLFCLTHSSKHKGIRFSIGQRKATKPHHWETRNGKCLGGVLCWENE